MNICKYESSNCSKCGYCKSKFSINAEIAYKEALLNKDLMLDEMLESLINETWEWSRNINTQIMETKFCFIQNIKKDIQSYINRNYEKSIKNEQLSPYDLQQRIIQNSFNTPDL